MSKRSDGLVFKTKAGRISGKYLRRRYVLLTAKNSTPLAVIDLKGQPSLKDGDTFTIAYTVGQNEQA